MNTLQLIPAIDIRHGHCVRLYKGDFDQETRYDVDPVQRVGWYRSLGANRIHIVDLDGAKEGSPQNQRLIANMATDGIAVQLGGGIRDRNSLERALQVADRVVVGSLAVSQPATVEAWLREYGGERIVLGFDVRISESGEPFLTTHGWTELSELTLNVAISSFLPAGLKHVLCTDVSRDGAMSGPNLELYQTYAKQYPQLSIQASGGVRNVADLDALAATGAAGAISGKALLDGRFTEEEIRRFLPDA